MRRKLTKMTQKVLLLLENMNNDKFGQRFVD